MIFSVPPSHTKLALNIEAEPCEKPVMEGQELK
jgi:hypothetical protein